MNTHDNLLRKKLFDPLVTGTYVTFADSIVSRMLGCVGYDFVWIDTEHTPVDYSTLRAHLDAIQLAGVSSVVRVGVDDPAHVKRVVDLGPDGIIFPMINTPEEAKRAMDLCIFPPEGKRGYGPLRALNYWFDDGGEYIKNHKESMVRIIQIETEEAVRNLPEIVKNEYIDGYILGPCDLSGSIGELGNVYGEHTVDLIKETISILKDAGKPVGIATFSTEPKELQYWYDLGISIISAGVDFGYLKQGAIDNLEKMKNMVISRKALL